MENTEKIIDYKEKYEQLKDAVYDLLHELWIDEKCSETKIKYWRTRIDLIVGKD